MGVKSCFKTFYVLTSTFVNVNIVIDFSGQNIDRTYRTGVQKDKLRQI